MEGAGLNTVCPSKQHPCPKPYSHQASASTSASTSTSSCNPLSAVLAKCCLTSEFKWEWVLPTRPRCWFNYSYLALVSSRDLGTHSSTALDKCCFSVRIGTDVLNKAVPLAFDLLLCNCLKGTTLIRLSKKRLCCRFDAERKTGRQNVERRRLVDVAVAGGVRRQLQRQPLHVDGSRRRRLGRRTHLHPGDREARTSETDLAERCRNGRHGEQIRKG